MVKMRLLARSVVALSVAGFVASLVASAVGAVGWVALPWLVGSPIMTVPSAGAFGVNILVAFVGFLIGAWVAARLAGRSPRLHAWVFGGLNAVANLGVMVLLPYPAWMWLAVLAMFGLAAWLGGALAARKMEALPATS